MLSAQSFMQTKEAYVPCSEMPKLIHDYTTDQESLLRFYTVEKSPERQQRMEKFNRTYLVRLQEIDFNQLSQECKADYILFHITLAGVLHSLDQEKKDVEALTSWFPFANQIYELEKLRRRGHVLNSQKTAQDFSTISKQVQALKLKLSKSPTLDAVSVKVALQTIEGLKMALNSVFEFYNGYDPLFTWWLPIPYSKLDSTLTMYADMFKEKQPLKGKYGIVAGIPVGKQELNRLLKNELIAYNVDELEAIAKKEFAWCQSEIIKVSKEMGFGEDYKAALEHVKNTYVEPGRQPEAILMLYNKSVDFIKENDLITVPPLAEEVWGMKMRFSEHGSGGYFQGGRSITITYPTNTWDTDYRLMAMRGNNPNFSFPTVQHELIPGHNLEFFMNDRHRMYRNFETPFWIEGWALYWEFILWDMGFPQTHEEKLGMLFWRIHRSARIIFTINYQTGKWTPEQAVDFLTDIVGHEKTNAISEVAGHVRPGNYPLYQMSYLVGGLQFYALKKELVDTGKMTLKEFHDNVMRLNEMPVEMIRAILLNKPLKNDFVPSWKFYSD
jgi:uncharacterized protein (DUF885 family)